ncbi:MAG: 2OG-Fe(II) oxygenase [Burkholderiales bacterium]
MSQASAQQITSELRDWIVAQAQAGHGPEAVLKSMIASGWSEVVAIDAMEATLADHLAADPNRRVPPAAALVPAAVPVPDAALADSPLYLDAADRRVHVVASMTSPRIIVLGNLLSADECDLLIAAATPRLARSLTVATKTGGEEINIDRTSNGMFFGRCESPLIARIEERIATLFGWPVENGEGLQVLHYRPGAEYKPHHDYFSPEEPGTASLLSRGGQRVATLIMYLNEPENGGATVFPDVHLSVAPKRGHAVFFSYDRPHADTKTLHGGAPVIAGEKWIATKWLRECEFA